MTHVARILCIAIVASMVLPFPGAFSDWSPADITPSAALTFPPGGGTCSTGLRVPAYGLVKGATLNVTGSSLLTNDSWSSTGQEIWTGAEQKGNLTLSPDGIGLRPFGSWWENDATEPGYGQENNITGTISPVLNVSAYSRVMVQGDFPNGTSYDIEILDPAANNTTLLKGLHNGDELNLSLWDGLEAPYRDLVTRLNVNIGASNITPVIRKWGVGTANLFLQNGGESHGLSVAGDIRLTGINEEVWSQKAGGATSRSFASVVWDPQDRQVLVFGGSTGATPHLNDLWAYDPSTDSWARKASAAGAAGRVQHTAVWDSTNRQMLVFGGYDGASRLNDLWAYNPTTNTWTQKASGATPRYYHTAVWDGQNGQMLVFGGYDGGYKNDLWAYSPSANSWSQKSGGASARDAHSAVWDSTNNRMLVFGGDKMGGTRVNDLWAYSPSIDSWTPMKSGATPRWEHSAVWVPGKEAMLIYGGSGAGGDLDDLWAYFPSTNTWTQKSSGATARVGAGAAWDPQNHQMLLFGGSSGGVPCPNAMWSYAWPDLPTGSISTGRLAPFLHTYGNLFVNATTPPNTGYRINVTDASNNTLLPDLQNGDPILLNVTTYPGIRLNLTLWTNDSTATPIVRQWGFGLHIRGPFQAEQQPRLDCTVLDIEGLTLNYTAGRWTQGAGGPTARAMHAAAWDPIRDQMLMFGGQDMVSEQFGDLWAYSPAGDSWAQKSSGPSPRLGSSAVWDTKNGQMILFGGITSAPTGETWVYDPALDGWARKADGPALFRHSAVWDPKGGQMIVFGAVNLAGTQSDTWAYDPSTDVWARKAPGPRARNDHCAVWDPDDGQMLVFGGNYYDIGPVYLGDTWAYRPLPDIWVRLSDGPSPRGGSTAVWDPGSHRMIVFGGIDLNIAYNEVWTFAPAKDRWDFHQYGPTPRTSHTAVWDGHDGQMIVFAGSQGVWTTCIDDLWTYKMELAARGSFSSPSIRTSYTPACIKGDSRASAPANTSVDVTFRISADNANWSDWVKLENGRAYTRSNMSRWGPYFQYIIRLTSSDPKTTPLLQRLTFDIHPYLLAGELAGGPAVHSEQPIVAARPSMTAMTAPGLQIRLYLSADDGTTWQAFDNDTENDLNSPGNVLRWRAAILGNGNGTPFLNGVSINYTAEQFPSDISMDVGADGTEEWHHENILDSTASTSNLTSAINGYIAAHRSEAEDGYLTVPISITSRTGGTIRLSDAAVDYVPSPRILSRSPTGTNVSVHDAIKMTFSEAMDIDSVNVTIDPPVNLTGHWSIENMNMTIIHPDFGENITYTVTVKAGALSNRGAPLVGDHCWNFTTLIDLPNVYMTDPLNGSLAVPSNKTVMIFFNELMDMDSTLDAFSISPVVNGTMSWRYGIGLGLLFQPLEGFPNGSYNITISSAKATDAAGNPLDGNYNGFVDGAADDYTFQFTVGAPAVVRPRLLSRYPEGDKIGLSEPVRMTFDRRMNLSSVSAAFVIRPAVAGTWSISANGTVIAFQPTAKYRPGRTYDITLNASASDVDGNALGSVPHWSFTTKPATPAKAAGFPWPLLAVLIVAIAAAAACIGLRMRQKRPPDNSLDTPQDGIVK